MIVAADKRSPNDAVRWHWVRDPDAPTTEQIVQSILHPKRKPRDDK